MIMEIRWWLYEKETKEKVMLRKGVITEEEIRRLWYEKESV